MHMVLDGQYWRDAIARHKESPKEDFIRKTLDTYAALGYTYLRDGGDRWGVGIRARAIAAEYGITYKTPGAPLCQKDHYGSFIGTAYENLQEYHRLVVSARETGLDFIKIMISGLMDFDRFGVLTEPGLPPSQIKALIHIAHEEGMSVMAHANGSGTVIPAAEAGVDSVEHGAYLNEEALWAMKEAGTVWVPTLSTVGNLRNQGRFDDTAVSQILDSALENVAHFHSIGGLIAPGTDAGAWRVPHGSETERPLLQQAGVTEAAIDKGIAAIIEKF